MKNKLALPVIILSIATLILTFYTLSSHFRTNTLLRETNRLRNAVDTLGVYCPPELKQDLLPLPYPGLSHVEQKKFQELGVTKEILFSDLRNKPELIPYEGVLGGRMHFPSTDMMWLPVDPWVLAYFEDGHIMGYLLAEYTFDTDGGGISWEVLHSQLK
ncbi:hypothetical protein CHISP_1802 [Chitinispirillum alkaliphilum]|nr:hypothetical protein CHISP_1802 [Chitinispirillum alkaliphilum]